MNQGYSFFVIVAKEFFTSYNFPKQLIVVSSSNLTYLTHFFYLVWKHSYSVNTKNMSVNTRNVLEISDGEDLRQ